MTLENELQFVVETRQDDRSRLAEQLLGTHGPRVPPVSEVFANGR